MRLPSLILLGIAAAAAGIALSPLDADSPQTKLGDGPVHILPFGLMGHVRELQYSVPMQVQVYNAGDGAIHLQSLDVRTVDGRQLAQIPLAAERLLGDSGELFDVHMLLEKLPLDISHRRSDRMFIPVDQIPDLDPSQQAELAHQIEQKISKIRRAGLPQARNLTFEVDLSRLFPSGALAGDEAVMDIDLNYTDASGTLKTVTYTHAVNFLEPYLGPPAEWQQRYGNSRAAGQFVAGDLHVHNCRDEAIAGCPSCAAESFNITGAFNNQQLRDQFLGLGYDYFSTTTHSYCIQGDNEFANVASEANSLDLADFVVLLGLEMTNKEFGPQQGSDIFDATCFLGGHWDRGIAHMGGHGLTSDKPGGQDYFLGACDGPIRNQDVNISETNSEGGFAIANHPGGSTLGFNSVDLFRGMERNMATGVEIWNHDVSSGKASAVHMNWWIKRLLEGKITYPYSGSDTHDEAVEFGANHTYITGALNDANLLTALKKGRTYLSNGPFLYNNLSDSSNRELIMGDIFQISASKVPPNYPVSIDSYYNTGTEVVTVRVYRGTVGDSDEVLLAEYINISGAGVLNTATTVPTSGTSWYRTELEADNVWKSAYATPCYIFLK
jgi:hypothetical protein